jgi:agmatine/peptidylarginine deiminase
MKLILTIILLSVISLMSAQPSAPVRMVAEWEPAAGTLIRWPLGIPSTLVQELAEDDTLYVLAETDAQITGATNSFTYWGMNLDHIVFIQTPTNSHWTRDWGPVSVFDGEGIWSIVDFIFEGYPWVPPRNNRNWQHDNAVNSVLADHFDAPLYDMPLYFTGGNVMTDGYGSAFSTEQMLAENSPLATPQEFFDIVEEYTGVFNYQIVDNFESHGIQHIDCVAKLLDEETVLIKRVPHWHQDFERIETIAEQFETMENCFGRPYEIFRVHDSTGVAAYTNSLILNDKVFVPLFDTDDDEAALQVYENAMPGYEIIGIYYDNWYGYDALHCRTMAIFDRHMLHIAHRPLDSQVPDSEDIIISTTINAHSNESLLDDDLKVYWRIEDGQWQEIQLESIDQDSFAAIIPMQPADTTIQYYIVAADDSGRSETLPRTAPKTYYEFTIFSNTQAEDEVSHHPITYLRNHPNPFNPETIISFHLNQKQHVMLEIINIKGQKVEKLFDGQLEIGDHSFTWTGSEVSSGIYFIKLETEIETKLRKAILLK